MHKHFTTSAARQLRAIRAGIFADPYSVIALISRAIVAEIISRFLIILEKLNRTKKLLKSLTWKDVGIIISVVVLLVLKLELLNAPDRSCHLLPQLGDHLIGLRT